MSVDVTTAGVTAAGNDSLAAKAARWVLSKVWFGAVLSGAYAIGQHYGWPQALLTAAAAAGALAVSVVSMLLPVWQRHQLTGAPLIDLAARLVVWLGLTAGVVGLLIGQPAVGCPAAALLINAAYATWRDRLAPLVRLMRYDNQTGGDRQQPVSGSSTEGSRKDV